jgi:hypothetical protein
MERLIVTARLRPGTEQEVERLVAAGPPFPPDHYSLERHSVHLGEGFVLFVFEGPGVEWVVQELVNDPVLGASLGAWVPLLEGQPTIAHEAYAWQRERV